MKQPTCALCGAGLTGDTTHRVATLDLCAVCGLGDPAPKLAERGIEMASRSWSEVHGSGNTRHTVMLAEVVGRVSQPLSYAVTFSRETLTHRITKLFRSELQAGDPLFDDAIWVETRDEAAVSELLPIEAFQTAVMELVGECAPVVIENGTLRVTTSASSTLNELPLLAPAAIILHVMDTIARGKR